MVIGAFRAYPKWLGLGVERANTAKAAGAHHQIDLAPVARRERRCCTGANNCWHAA
jgi:hypothetical protein